MIAIINIVGILGLCIALGAGFFIEVFYHCTPCSLCFLQRLSMGGIAMGLLLNLRFGVRPQHYALSLLWALFGLFVALRHMAFNVCSEVKDGFKVFSYGLYTWSFSIFFLSLLSIALLLLFSKVEQGPLSRRKSYVVGSVLLFCLVLGALSVLRKMGLDF